MTTVQFYPLDVTYKVVGGKPRFYVFGRTLDNERICLIDENFRPYFYIIIKHTNFDEFVKKIKSIRVKRKDRECSIIGVEIERKKYMGDEVKAIKAYTDLPKDILAIAEKIKSLPDVSAILETDILLIRRYLIDNGIVPWILSEAEGEMANLNMGMPTMRISSIKQSSTEIYNKPKILAFDLETYNPRGKEFDMEKNPILMISFYSEGYRKVITHKRIKTDVDYIEFVDSEMELLERAKEVISEVKPDVLAGYYSDGFDMPYLMYRAKKYKIKFDIGLDQSEPELKGGAEPSIKINGITHFDLYKIFIGVMDRSLNLTSYSLDSVSEALLGEHKKEVDIENLWKHWNEGNNKELENYAVYNLKDSELTYKLCLKVMDVMKELVKLVGVPMFNSARMAFSQLVEWYLIKRASEFNEIVPNKPEHVELIERMTSDPVKGGFVFEPKPGVYEKIAVLDFRSLYPSVMAAHNISPSTINCKCCKYGTKTAPIEDKKVWFCRKKKGFLVSVIKDIIERRARIKDMIKDQKDSDIDILRARELALKTIANSFYGYLGFFISRWYSKDCAAAVTAYGRQYITSVINKASEQGYELLYSDTDSVFLLLGDKKLEDVMAFKDKVNSDLPELIELEFEGYFKKGLFVATKEGSGAKKKYALVDEKNNILVKGFELVRRNVPQIAREVQFEVMKLVLKDDLEKVKEFLEKTIERVVLHKVAKDKLVISTQLSKKLSDYETIMPHVAVAKRLVEKGVEVEEGDRIDYIICTGEGKLKDKAKALSECSVEDYDAEYYVNNQIIPVVSGILKLVNIDIEKYKFDEKDQEKLDKFF